MVAQAVLRQKRPLLIAPWADLWDHRELIAPLVARDIVARYRGSVLGIFWLFATPVMMLAVYSFVFGTLFSMRWSEQTYTSQDFALIMFCGMVVFNPFAEAINRAPRLVLDNATYAKKIVFPLQILPLVATLAAQFTFITGAAILLIFVYITERAIPPTVALLPVAVLPAALLSLGLSWLLAALGVFLRDLSHVVALGVTLLMFLSPVFYPIDAIPEGYRWIVAINPIAASIDAARDLVFWGRLPNLALWGTHLGASLAVFYLGFFAFNRTKRAFADVI